MTGDSELLELLEQISPKKHDTTPDKWWWQCKGQILSEILKVSAFNWSLISLSVFSKYDVW